MTPPGADPDLLDGVALFAGLDGAARVAVLDHAAWYSVPGGNILFAQGEAGDALYVLLRGSMAVLRVAADGVRRRIARCCSAARCIRRKASTPGPGATPRAGRRRARA